MFLKLPTKQFLGLIRQALPFMGQGREVDPGLGFMLLEARENRLMRMSAHDARVGILVTSPVTESQPGSLALGLAQVNRLNVVLSEGGETTLHRAPAQARAQVVCGLMKLEVPVMDPEYFLPMPKPAANVVWAPITVAILDDIITHVSWAACRDNSRPNLAGVHLSPECSEATNGQLMAIMRPGVTKNIDVVIPSEVWHRLRGLVEARTGEVHLAVEGNRVWLRTRHWAVYGQLLTTTYPSTKGVAFDLEDSEICWLACERHSILSVVRHIIGASTGQDEKKVGAAVAFEFRDGDMHLISAYPFDDLSTSMIVDEVVSCTQIKGDTAHLRGLGLYSQYARWALEALSDEQVLMVWAPASRSAPVQFHDPKHGLVAMIMPRRL
jgi:DNA polymerase III sliding clamp (beta) subunit (PCNA family)